MNHFLIIIFSFLFVYFFTFLVRKFATKTKFIDHPEERKFHKKPTPLMGGISILFGIAFSLIFTRIICKNLLPDTNFLIYFLAGLILISILGLYDDLMGMKPSIKFSIQSIIALIYIFGAKFTFVLGSPFITVPILLLWIVGLMNALNFLDNMDGITPGIAIIIGIGFFALGALSKNHSLSLIACIFVGSNLGFVIHNFNPAKIFLGDAGSMLIGYTLSALGIILLDQIIILNNNFINFSVLLPILLLSYAIFDISLVSFTRKRDGRYILQGGKDHSTHRIGNATGSIKITACMVYLINLIIVLISIIVFETNNQYLTLIITIIFAFTFFFFGEKLDNIPIVISENQLKKKSKNIT